MTDKEIFDKKIIPIMNKVRDYIQNKQAEEMKEHLFSPASILSGGVGPDGGMTAHSTLPAMSIAAMFLLYGYIPK